MILQFRLNLGATEAQLLKNHSGQARLTFMRVALSHGSVIHASLALQTHFAYTLFYLY